MIVQQTDYTKDDVLDLQFYREVKSFAKVQKTSINTAIDYLTWGDDLTEAKASFNRGKELHEQKYRLFKSERTIYSAHSIDLPTNMLAFTWIDAGYIAMHQAQRLIALLPPR